LQLLLGLYYFIRLGEIIMDYKQLYKEITKNSLIYPKKVIISTTDGCNLKCKICWRLDKNYDPNTKIKNELSFNEINKILSDCKKMKVNEIDLTGGGEPFFRKDIFDLIKSVKDNGFFCTLTTNATLLDRSKVEMLVKLGLDDICFSIESLDKKINDSVRGNGTAVKVVNAIKEFNIIKQNLKKQNPKIRLSVVLTNKNYAYLSSLSGFCNKNNISAVNFSVLLDWNSAKKYKIPEKKWSEVKSILLKLNSDFKKNNIYTNLDSIIKYGLYEHRVPDSCFAPWELLFINSHGKVMGCCILASFYSNIVGDVRKNSIINIWKGKEMESFRAKIKNKHFFNECKRCLPEFTDIYSLK
jgi:radical SAM protein with 4Fe4S-binding SPASM domain